MNETEGRQEDLNQRVRSMMDTAWRPPGFCVPNLEVYPHQWLWDSCFHALIWARLGDDRAVTELATVFAYQAPSGFVPHMTYWEQPSVAKDFWGRELTSSITQPPMYGHVAAELVRAGFELPLDLVHKIEAAFRHLLVDRERTSAGLVPIFHPWESGCDDSPRWDDSLSFDAIAWKRRKGRLVSSLQFDAEMAPMANAEFAVGSVGFNSLTVFNFLEFCSISGVRERQTIRSLSGQVEQLRRVIESRWDSTLATWVDDSGLASAGCRTVDALLALLVVDKDSFERERVYSQLQSSDAFAGRFGLAGVHRQEASFDAAAYWRGPSWPQLNYLLSLAVLRAGNHNLARDICAAQQRGAVASGLAEYWHPDSGLGLGAMPQSWAGLALVEPTV